MKQLIERLHPETYIQVTKPYSREGERSKPIRVEAQFKFETHEQVNAAIDVLHSLRAFFVSTDSPGFPFTSDSKNSDP